MSKVVTFSSMSPGSQSQFWKIGWYTGRVRKDLGVMITDYNTMRENLGLLTLIDMRRLEISVCKAWPVQHDTIHGQGLAQIFRAWRKPGPRPCCRLRHGPGAWMRSQANLMKTRLGLASKIVIMNFWEMY